MSGVGVHSSASRETATARASRDRGQHLVVPGGVNPEPRSRLPDQLDTGAFLVYVTTAGSARSGVDAAGCRQDDLRASGDDSFPSATRYAGT